MFLAHRFDLGAHRLVSKGAKRQPERGMFLFNHFDDRFGRADRIARLISAIALDLAPTPYRRLGVGLDGLLRRFQGAAGQLVRNGPGSTMTTLISNGATSFDSASDSPSTANFVAA